MKSNKKKAFTLTELLVVVIVIGVLSAAVLPKFSKVIETRKTTEAEELMASVRTEQEKRCALDKQYLTQMSEMKDIVKNNDAKNFTITLAERGIDAESKGKYSYTLKMPSYADGRICCDGNGCAKLNKNYPTCEELKKKPDYQESPADCAGVIVEPEEPSGPCDIDPYSCECDPNQAKCCAEDEVWQDGKCSPKPKECTGPKPETSQECNKCGTQTRTVTCDGTTGEWVEGEWGQCSKEEKDCPKDLLCSDFNNSNFADFERDILGGGTLASYCGDDQEKVFVPKNAPASKENCCVPCAEVGGKVEDGECSYARGGTVSYGESGIWALKFYPEAEKDYFYSELWGKNLSAPLESYRYKENNACNFSNQRTDIELVTNDGKIDDFKTKCANDETYIGKKIYKKSTKGYATVVSLQHVGGEEYCNFTDEGSIAGVNSSSRATVGISIISSAPDSGTGPCGDSGSIFIGANGNYSITSLSDIPNEESFCGNMNKNRNACKITNLPDGMDPMKVYRREQSRSIATKTDKKTCHFTISSYFVDIQGVPLIEYACQKYDQETYCYYSKFGDDRVKCKKATLQ